MQNYENDCKNSNPPRAFVEKSFHPLAQAQLDVVSEAEYPRSVEQYWHGIVHSGAQPGYDNLGLTHFHF